MELISEQKEAIQRAVQIIVDALKKFFDQVKKVFAKVQALLTECEPRKRYKIIKSIGIKNYVPFFQRRGIVHCRNNC